MQSGSINIHIAVALQVKVNYGMDMRKNAVDGAHYFCVCVCVREDPALVLPSTQ